MDISIVFLMSVVGGVASGIGAWHFSSPLPRQQCQQQQQQLNDVTTNRLAI